MERVSRLRTHVAGVLLAALVAGGQGVTASVAPSPKPSAPPSKAPSKATSKTPSKAQSMAAERSGAASAAQSLGLGTGERLVVRDVLTDADGSTHVRYDRTFGGLRVIGGDLVSHRDGSGKSEGVSWNGAHQAVVASLKPRVSLASASAAGTRKASLAQKATADTKAELVVYSVGTAGKASPKAPKLAYDVLTEGVGADQTPSRLHTIVDAGTGATLTTWDEIENVTGTGTGRGVRVGTVPVVTTAGTSWSMRDAVGNYTTDLKGATSTATGTTFTDADNIWGNGAVSNRASAGVDAHYGAGKTFDYFKNILGRNGIRGNGVGARSRVHFGNGYVNAFWDGTQMTYGDGAGNAKPLTSVDVAAHEMTHGVTENTAGLVGDGEAGGLNEATSDIFGTAVEWYANNASDVGDYLIGEKVDVNGNGTPLRYQDRPSRDGLSPNCWSASLGDLDVHHSAGPLNHWFYLASEGSGAKVINGVSYNSPTCNASTVTPIGRDKAAKIWYRTLTTYLTSGSDYAAAREGAIQSAKDLYGSTSTECAGVAAAFSAVTVRAGAQACGTTAPLSLGRNLLRNPGFESGDTLWSATPGLIGQWGAVQPAQPARSGKWDAWMGGFGQSHTGSISQLVTIPASTRATLTYYVHIDTDEASSSPVRDTLKVRVGSTVVQTLSNRNAAMGYVRKTVSLSAYVGRTISLRFTDVENASRATSFVLDDLSIVASRVPTAPRSATATGGNAQALVTWTAPASNGGSAVTRYRVTASPGGKTATVTGATTATVAGLANGRGHTFTITATNAAGTSARSSPSAAVTPRKVGFTGRTPIRVLDTRAGVGAPRARLGAGRSVTLKVPGLPAGTTAVTLNVTVAGPTARGYLTVYPGGVARPRFSNLSFVANRTIANMVVVKLGAGNKVTFYNARGAVNVAADLMGSYAPGSSTGPGFTGRTPVRVLDTRAGVGAPRAKLGAGRSVTLTVRGLPAGTTAVALNVTVTGPTASSYLTAYPRGVARPRSSNLNFVAGKSIANLVVVKLGAGSKVTFFNVRGAVNVIADLVGFYAPSAIDGFTGRTPARVLDTRVGVGAPRAKVGAGKSVTLRVPGLPAGTTSVALNVTVTGPTATSYLTVYPGGVARPNASNLNFMARQTIANMVLVPLGASNKVTFYNAGGTVSVIADLVGYHSRPTA